MVAADWSGARTGEARHLWLAEWDPGAGMVAAVESMSRQAAGDRILDLAWSDPGLVAGLDFGFSLPAWWLRACGIGSAPELWADAERLEGWLAGCEPPFWGRPGKRRPALAGSSEWRLTELAAHPRPGSVFQIGGAGAVGTASLRGMPTLERLRRAGFAPWPFTPWALPAVVEVWPRLAIGSTVKSSAAGRRQWLQPHSALLHPAVRAAAEASADAFDAVAAVVGLAGRGFVPRPTPADPVVRLEGWIDGIGLVP